MLEKVLSCVVVVVAVVLVTFFAIDYFSCVMSGGEYVKPLFGVYKCIEAKN